MATPSPEDLGRAASAQIPQTEWQLEAEPTLDAEGPVPAPIPGPVPLPTRISSSTVDTSSPPPALRIVEALLFVGGPPLTLDTMASVLRGMTPDQVREAIDTLNRLYRQQNRPYWIQATGSAFQLSLRSDFRAIRDQLYGGPREVRLSQSTLDVLALVAYRQPIGKTDLDSLRGSDTTGFLRQLVRLGLLAMTRRTDTQTGEIEVGYSTTQRFLDLFGLASLEDLPRLADPSRG